MTSSIIYTRVNVKLEAGKTHFSDHISLEKGTCVGVHFDVMKDTQPEFPVEISINNAQGGILLNPTDYRDYVHKGGGYFQGMKQVSFPTDNNRFFVSVIAEQTMSSDFVGQLVFTIQRDCECENQ